MNFFTLKSTNNGKNREMVNKVPEFHEKLEAELGCNQPNLQVFYRSKESHLHDKCHRIAEFHLSKAEPPEERISKRYSPFKSTLSGDF